MLTEFGKILRKLRIDNQELLKDMATKLSVSSAYLSAVETGNRKVPLDWSKRISELYNLCPEATEDLECACERSAQEVKISLATASGAQKETAIAFAKALDGLDDEKLKQIMQVVNGKKR